MAAAALLLELAAADDLSSFKRAVKEHNLPLDAAALWYCRSSATRSMGLHHRTPLHIAALYGSSAVLTYLISANPALVNAPSASDAATPLHCAAAGAAPSSPDTIKTLLAAAADPDALDSAGNRPADVLAASSPLDSLLSKTKREYPADLTLPDIKTGVYSTDEFRIYAFKVKPCSRAYSHDWTECPFVHPGENARRRDPSKFVYSCVPCPEFKKSSNCRSGDACEYAHGVFESWLHPAQYRTRLCKEETNCSRRVCFFAHKKDELRTVNPMAGLTAPSSPRSPSIGDMAAALMMMQPGSPVSSLGMNIATTAAACTSTSPLRMNQPPPLQLSSSRLKSSLSARDMEFNPDFAAMEAYQQKLINDLSSAASSASPRSNLRVNALTAAAAAASRASDYSDLLGSIDPSMLSQLQGLSHKQSMGNQMHQAMSQQMLSGYGGNLNMPSSPTMSASSSLGLDHSTAKAVLSSRASAFAQRSQSFIDRGAISHQQSVTTSGLSNWGSPDGRLDWGFQGEEVNKLRKSASFATRSKPPGFAGPASPKARPTAARLDEPDLSWVNSLVKDGPAAPPPTGQAQKRQYQINSGRGYLASDMLLPWAEQMYAEQEQMVA